MISNLKGQPYEESNYAYVSASLTYCYEFGDLHLASECLNGRLDVGGVRNGHHVQSLVLTFFHG